MLRKLAAKLHLYLGLLTGIVLIPIGLTGSVLVFDDEIDAALHPELLDVQPEGMPASVDAVVAAVRAAFPEERIARMELLQTPSSTYEVILRGEGRHVYVHPYTARVIGSRLPEETLTGWLFLLHTSLLAGENGKTFVGVIGLLLLVIGVTGLVLWWRGWRNVRRGLTVKWNASAKRVNYDLHNAVGFWAALPLLAVTFTGAGLIFYSAFSGLAHAVTGTPLPPPPPRSTYVAGLAPPSVDTLLARAQAALPEARLARIEFPATPEATYRVRLRMPGELHPIGLSMVFLDQYSGEVLHAESALEVPKAQQFGYWFYPLHIGSFGGLAVRVLYALIGLAPVLLAVTGFIWWVVRKRKKEGGRGKKEGGKRRKRDGGRRKEEAVIASGDRPFVGTA